MSEFKRFHWAWPGNHQPLQAIVLLLKEIDSNPNGHETQASCFIIDETIALCGPDGGVSGLLDGGLSPRPLTEGGQEAWSLIKRLRATAWIKAGLDPDVLPLREDVKAASQVRLNEMISSGGVDHPVREVNVEPQSLGALEGHLDTALGTSGIRSPNLNWDDWDAMFGGVQ